MRDKLTPAGAPQQPSYDPLAGAAEGLVGCQIGPGGAPLRRIDSVRLGLRQAPCNLRVDLGIELFKARVHCLQIFMKRLPAAPGHPLDAFAECGDRGQMFRPEVVEGSQRNHPFEIRRARSLAAEDGLPPPVDRLALALDNAFILVKKLPDIEILALDQALDTFRIVAVLRTFNAVLDDQIILE